ncbi:alpha/beta hydrolase [Microbaculum marinum]|uniref:Alpha/beta hydrolase n=1 Tax=Microbaculum marinum TaxID=1764581 RepID=A0AAW9RUC9_9HYPH
MQWHLRDSVATSAGRVAAGSAGDGPALVLAHGWPWSSYSWHRVLPRLAENFRVHWYDMPGFGQSEMKPGQRTGLDVQGEIFSAMLDHWNLRKPRVVAHDFGGAITLRAHLLHGCEYDRLVLMNVVAMRPWGSAFFDHVGRYTEAFSGLPPHIHEAVVRAYIKGALVGELLPEDLEALVAPWLSENGRISFYNQFAQADERYTAEIEPMFGSVRCPVRILWGEDDPWIPLERGRSLHSRMPGSEFATMPGLGHLPQLENPETVLEKLLPFLRSGSG